MPTDRGVLTTKEMEALEAMIDRTSLYTVTLALADTVADKADHIRANWQDRGLALVWERCGRKLVRAAAFIREKGI